MGRFKLDTLYRCAREHIQSRRIIFKDDNHLSGLGIPRGERGHLHGVREIMAELLATSLTLILFLAVNRRPLRSRDKLLYA